MLQGDGFWIAASGVILLFSGFVPNKAGRSGAQRIKVCALLAAHCLCGMSLSSCVRSMPRKCCLVIQVGYIIRTQCIKFIGSICAGGSRSIKCQTPASVTCSRCGGPVCAAGRSRCAEGRRSLSSPTVTMLRRQSQLSEEKSTKAGRRVLSEMNVIIATVQPHVYRQWHRRGFVEVLRRISSQRLHFISCVLARSRQDRSSNPTSGRLKRFVGTEQCWSRVLLCMRTDVVCNGSTSQ